MSTRPPKRSTRLPAQAPLHPTSPPARKRPPWMVLKEPTARLLKAYALDPSAGNYVGNIMPISVPWEHLKPGPVGRRFAVIDYDGANRVYYPPVDLNDYRILAQGGLDPSESDPRFHQQMVYAVAAETLEKFQSALGRRIHWRRTEHNAAAPVDPNADAAQRDENIWVLKLYPHAMIQANAYYSRQAHGILFGYFRAVDDGQGNNLPGQRVFTCLSHDIIAHEVTHAVIDGIRAYFTEPTNPDVLAFHEAFADLTALFLHFSHKEALLDTIRKTGGQLYRFELQPDAAPVAGNGSSTDATALIGAAAKRNPLVELARQFGEASGKGRALRYALDQKARPDELREQGNDPHARGSVLVAAVFDAYFSTYVRAAADLFRIFQAGGGSLSPAELPTSLANLLSETAADTADQFFRLCAQALDYCPPVDVTFGDFLRALLTVSVELQPEDARGVRQALMQAFRARGLYPEDASFFSEDALCWPPVSEWQEPPEDDALRPVIAKVADPATGRVGLHALVFSGPEGASKAQNDLNGAILRQYALDHAERLGFDADPTRPPEAPSFHQVFRTRADGRIRVEMVVELVQTRLVPFDPGVPEMGSFPLRGGVTLIVAAPDHDDWGRPIPPKVRFAIGKRISGLDGQRREERQRRHCLALGLANGRTDDDRRFQADFGLIHAGV